MDPEPRNDTGDRSHLVGGNSTEVPRGGNVTSLNTTDITDWFDDSEYISRIVILSIMGLICLCGMVGNGTVIWLLGFRTRRNPYSVYILNLAVADFLFLLATAFRVIHSFCKCDYHFYVFQTVLALCSYPVGLILLMAVSAERCVSVLWPLWYKCHRPAHLSTILCALIWGLCFIYFLLAMARIYFQISSLRTVWDISDTMSLPTLLVIFVSSLILVIWGRCCSPRRQPSKLYWTVLLNVLAVLLLSVPKGVCALCCWRYFFKWVTWHLLILLSALNSSVNPVIYFLVGRHGEQRGRKPLREVLQTALTDGEAGTEQRGGITGPRQDVTTPEHQGGEPRPVPMSDPAPGTASGKVSDSPLMTRTSV